MRKIESAMLEAIKAKRDWVKDNTSVHYNDTTNSSVVRLHGNLIAFYCHDLNEYRYSYEMLSRYPTVTTKSRLRAMGASVTTKKGVTFLDGVAV